MASQPQGFGRQNLGFGLMGAGGPLTVVRAIAVAGQVVRVVFNEEPLHQTASGAMDALNPANYSFTVPAGNATSPVPMGVSMDMVVGPAYGVGNGGSSGERGFDVGVDKQLIVGVTYRVTVRNLQSAAGGALGSPIAANFPGVTILQETKLPARNQDLVDFANPAALGHWVVDDSGDITSEDPDAGTRKRCYRRLTTKRDAFSTLPGYGAGVDHKSVASPAKLASLRVDGLTQVQLEPDVASASMSVGMQPTGVCIIQLKAKTQRGTFVDTGAKVSAVGSVSPT